MTIEWKLKHEKLKKIFDLNRKKNYYDCLLPISGGKDSTFQSYVLTKNFNLIRWQLHMDKIGIHLLAEKI